MSEGRVLADAAAVYGNGSAGSVGTAGGFSPTEPAVWEHSYYY